MSVEQPLVDPGLLSQDPPVATLPALVIAAAEADPDREFLRFEDRSMTFGEVERKTAELAGYLAALGVRPGERVAIMLPNVIGWPLGWLSILRAGAIAVPINAAYRAADLEHVLRDSGARVVLSLPQFRATIEAARVDLDHVLDIDETLSACAGYSPPDVAIGPDSLANLQYTSGTTGFPKACMLTHDYWVRMGWLTAGLAGLTEDDVALTAQPYSYIDPQWNTAMCLTARIPLVVLPRFSASGFWPDVRRHRATIFYVLGTMPMLLLKQPPSPQDRDNDVRLVLCSGIVPDLHKELEQRWGAPWREAYGMTESGADLVSPVEDLNAVGSGTMGIPVPTKQIRIVDELGNEVPDGEPGELIVHGRPMMLGYWNLPEVTAKTIVNGWLHTGDVAVRDKAGRYRLVGRLKDMVRRGGENIASAEVEGVIGQHPDVHSAAVVGVPDDLFGEEVKVFIRLQPGVQPDRATAKRILEHARDRLARFKVPRFVEFVAEFPMTPSERIAKPTLVALSAQQPGPNFDFNSSR
ncbi:MAG: class I adenylate-forming enzyme family protein [Actinomycetota bacterium]